MERLSLLFVGILGVQPLCFDLYGEASSSRNKAKKIYKILVGMPLSESNPKLDLMERLINRGDDDEAGRVAVSDPDFYDLTLRSWAAPLTNPERLQDVPFDDMQALIFGVVRDRLDARLLLTGNFLYRSNLAGVPEPSRADNNHYSSLENRGTSLISTLERVSPQWPNIDAASGVFTTRAWGEAYYSAGTNRRALQHAFEVFMCRPLPSIRDASLPENYIRRDVDRAPGGNPRIFQQDCRGCHSGMDALAGAFSRWDMEGGVLTYLGKDQIAAKYNINATTYPEGFITLDDSWINLWTKGHNENMGWRGPLRGKGLKAFATMLSNSEGFSGCMVDRTVKALCRASVDGVFTNELLQKFKVDFEEGHYDLSQLFISVALSEECQ